jgi:predicted flap endonuclease-1-like 5' DNA nuclease
MPNAPHILETALLLLAAFLVGCVTGYLLRRLAAGRSRRATGRPVASAPLAETAEALVIAPRIKPITAPSPKPTSAQRLAAAVREPRAEAVPVVDTPAIEPAQVAVATTSGAAPEQPEAPAVEPEPAVVEVVAAEVPPIDEAAHVVEPDLSPVVEAVAAPAIEISRDDLSGSASARSPRNPRKDEAEDAAMRAIEGGWTPRAAPQSTPRRVELPEPIDAGQPAPQESRIIDNAGASPAEIEGALSAARSAVAAASAAAEAAIAEYLPPVAREAEAPTAKPDVASPGRPINRAPFGRPAALDAPRDGRKDELRQVKGISPQVEAALNHLGIFHFDQIAVWDKKAVVWIDNHLALKGKPGREKWIEQARDLAKARVPALRAVKH